MSYAALNVLYLWEIAIQMGSWVVMIWSLQFLYSAHTESCRFSMAPAFFPQFCPWCHQQSCCSPWMYTGVCTQINTHMYTHVCLFLPCPCSRQLISQISSLSPPGHQNHHNLTLLLCTLSLGCVREEALRPFFLGCFAIPEMQEEQWPFSSAEELFL